MQMQIRSREDSVPLKLLTAREEALYVFNHLNLLAVAVVSGQGNVEAGFVTIAVNLRR